MSIQKNQGLSPKKKVAILDLISEQGAIPVDQLARFLKVHPARAAAIVRTLVKDGTIKERLFTGSSPWVWLTHKGAKLSKTGLNQTVPTVRLLTHRRAVNEVRLYLRQRAPQGRWVCERTVARHLDPEIPLPDALFEINGERHAIEVELSRKETPALRAVIASHSNRYDAVLYFCSPRARTGLDKLRELYDWPKLSVRDVPGMEQLLTTRSKGFELPLREANRRPPGTRRRKHARLSNPRHRPVLSLIAEQGAIPVDQLSRFLDYHAQATDELVEQLCADKLARRESLLAEEADWVWLTYGGNRLSGTELSLEYLPAPGALGRLRAINEVRLHIAAHAPQANWIGYRALRRELSGSGQIPKAVVEIGDERHAIEVELTRKPTSVAIEMVEHRSAHYDAVVCFCAPRSRRLYERLAKENYWPKLVIHPVTSLSLTSQHYRRSSPSSCC